MSSPTGGPHQPAGPFIPFPGDDDATEESRRLDIARRELNAFAQHVRRSRQVLLAHYEQLAWMQTQLGKREDKLHDDDQRLMAVRSNLDQRLRELDDRHRTLEQRQRELDQRQRVLDQRERNQAEQLGAAADQHQRELDAKRRAEQERGAAELAEMQRRHQQLQEEIARDQERLAGQRTEFEKMRLELEGTQRQQRDRSASETTEMEKTLATEAEQIAHERQDIAQAEATLQKRRDEVARMMAEFKQMQEGEQQRGNLEHDRLREEIAALQQQLMEHDQDRNDAAQQLARATAAFAQTEAELRAEIETLRSQGAAPRRSSGVRPLPPAPLVEEAPAVEEEPVAEVHGGMAESELSEVSGLETCEAQLGEFRKLVQADRHAVEEDLRNLQTHRGGETAPAPQRAPLAPALAQLNQLRQEIHMELDRLQQERPGIVVVAPSPEPSSRQPVKKHQTPTTKSRGTFLGLRRWLTGG